MRIVIGGSSGFLGSALVTRLIARGDDVVRLVRRPANGPSEMQWDPESGSLDVLALEDVDAIVNLGGVGIGDSRWSTTHKAAVLQSRLDATGTLARVVGQLENPPGVFVSGSAIGHYGDRSDETLTEDSGAGPHDDFLVEVVTKWEAAAMPVAQAGVPLALLRTGLVLSGSGGLLKRLLLPFKLGLGGAMGSGDQWWSWISLEDQLRAMMHIIDSKEGGAFNLTAPSPVRNKDFGKSLARALHRPAIVPTPRFALNLVLGAERAQALVFTSARVLPQALQATGFEFKHETLDESWPEILG
ncbi:MAG: TIGR01777 family protein [bacterium]|nr:TIGR01777 family protein [bacterium]